jgi:hypothetical protein
MEPVIGEYGFRTPDEATIMSDELGIGPIHSDEIEGRVVFVPGKSREAFNGWIADKKRSETEETEALQAMQEHNQSVARGMRRG